MSLLVEQYNTIRASLPPDTILLMRIGHFYEAFGMEARTVAAVTGATLTKRAGVIMAGIPYHGLDAAMTKLVAKGHKVAIAGGLTNE